MAPLKMEVDHRGKWIRGWIGAKGGLGSKYAPGMCGICEEKIALCENMWKCVCVCSVNVVYVGVVP